MSKQIFREPFIETNSVEVLSTKLISITNELTCANKELARYHQERSLILANISHDLRAPVAAIRSAIDLLLSGQALTEVDTLSAIKLIDSRTTSLQTMIQDMYLLFTLENNELPLHYDTISSGPFFEEYYYNALIDKRFEHKNMYLDLSVDLEVWITIDIQHMIRVLDNLFTNAAKYSMPGADITLSIHLNPDFTHLLIKVIDTGIGIPTESIDKIFDRTYTVSSSRTPNSSTGSGLGLSIVKTIVEKFNGKIYCESQINQGSTFTILLPITQKGLRL